MSFWFSRAEQAHDDGAMWPSSVQTQLKLNKISISPHPTVEIAANTAKSCLVAALHHPPPASKTIMLQAACAFKTA